MNCKKGDLATVVRGSAVGAVVECVEFLGNVRPFGTPFILENCWRVRLLSGATNHFGEYVSAGKTGRIEDDSLRPLPKDPDADIVDETNKIEDGVAA